MPAAPLQNGPATPTNPSSGAKLPTLSDVLDSGLKVADKATDVLSKANLPEAAKAIVKTASVIADTKASVLKLDSAVKDLEKAAPGTTELVKKTAETFALASKALGDVKDLPASIQPIAAKAKETTEAFAKFAKDYDDYTKAGPLGKLTMMKSTMDSWKEFNTKFTELNTELDKSGLAKKAADTAGKVLDGISSFLK